MNLVLREDLMYDPSVLIKIGIKSKDIKDIFMCFNKDSLYRYEEFFINEGILFEFVEVNNEIVGIIANYDFPDCLSIDEYSRFRIYKD